jgi:hypothetical protein
MIDMGSEPARADLSCVVTVPPLSCNCVLSRDRAESVRTHTMLSNQLAPCLKNLFSTPFWISGFRYPARCGGRRRNGWKASRVSITSPGPQPRRGSFMPASPAGFPGGTGDPSHQSPAGADPWPSASRIV